MIVFHYDQLDGFRNVTFTCKHKYGFECIKSFRWKVECDEFIYRSTQKTNWHDQVWASAKKMFNKEVKHVL